MKKFKYDKTKKPKVKHKSYLKDLIFYNKTHKVSLMEKVVKFLIFIALRIAIAPSKWKDPKKNYEIIDRTYKRIMSNDLIFIPSSIAFYLIMAFMPITSMILFSTTLPVLRDWISSTSVNNVLGNFIPGISSILQQLKDFETTATIGEKIGSWALTIFSLLITAWIASGGFAKLIYTQSYIFEYKFLGGYWMNRIKGMVIVFSLSLGLVAALSVDIYLESLFSKKINNQFLLNLVSYVFIVINLFLLLFLGILCFFKFSPRYKIKFRHLIPGAMVFALPTTGFLALFGFVTSFWAYDSYGILGAIMYVGMSSLIICNFLFMGIISNAAYYKTFINKRLEKKWTVSKK